MRVQTSTMINRLHKLRVFLEKRLRSTRSWFVEMTKASLVIITIIGALYLSCAQSSFWIGVATITSVTLFVLFVLWFAYFLAMAILMVLPPANRSRPPLCSEARSNEPAIPMPLPVLLAPPRFRLAIREAY